MSYALIATGTSSSLGQLEQYQSYFPELSEGYLELELRSEVAIDIVTWLAEKLNALGVPANAVKTDGRFVQIYFRTEIAPLVLIAGAIAAVIFLVGLIVAWKLYKLAPSVVAGLATGTVLLVIAGILVVLVLIATKGRLGFGGSPGL